jgi:dihydropyrimidinase
VTLSAREQATQNDYNPYAGWVERGAVEKVLIRGAFIVDDGRFLGKRGQVRFLHREESVALS